MRRSDSDAPIHPDPLRQLELTGDLPLELFLTFRVNLLSSAFERQWSRFLREEAGVSLAEWRLMAVLHQGPSTFARLVELTAMNKALAHRSARTLAEAGHVDIVPTPGDARSTTLSLTRTGGRLFDRFRPFALERQRGLLSVLTPPERTALYSMLDRLQDAALKWEARSKARP